METQHSGQLSCIRSRTVWSLMLICVYFNTCIVYWNWISKYGAVFILNVKKIDKIKKKKIQCLCHVFMYSLYGTCISKIFLERDMIWLSTILAAIILVLALSSPTFFCVLQSARPLQTLRAPKPLDFIIRQNWSPGQERN